MPIHCKPTGGAGGTVLHAMDDILNHSSTDIAVLNATTSKHGFIKKLDNDPLHYMNGQGNWTTPAGGGGEYVWVKAQSWGWMSDINFAGLAWFRLQNTEEFKFFVRVPPGVDGSEDALCYITYANWTNPGKHAFDMERSQGSRTINIGFALSWNNVANSVAETWQGTTWQVMYTEIWTWDSIYVADNVGLAGIAYLDDSIQLYIYDCVFRFKML